MGGRCPGRPRQAGRRVVRSLRACSPAKLTNSRRQDTALSVSGGRTGTDEESVASAKRRKQRTTGHRAVSVFRVLSGAVRGRLRKTRQRLQRRPQERGAGLQVVQVLSAWR